MHQPCTRIVSLESNNKPAASRQHGNVTTRGIGILKDAGVAESARSGSHEVEIVPMEMNWVGCYCYVSCDCLDDPKM